jgi:hypothetical protein
MWTWRSCFCTEVDRQQPMLCRCCVALSYRCGDGLQAGFAAAVAWNRCVYKCMLDVLLLCCALVHHASAHDSASNSLSLERSSEACGPPDWLHALCVGLSPVNGL